MGAFYVFVEFFGDLEGWFCRFGVWVVFFVPNCSSIGSLACSFFEFADSYFLFNSQGAMFRGVSIKTTTEFIPCVPLLLRLFVWV